MRPLVLCTTLLSMASLALGQVDPDRTGGFPNGRAWSKLPISAKAYYMTGIKDGRMIAMLALPSTAKQCTQAISNQEPQGFLVGDFVKVLDEFYKEPANVNVPIIYAYDYVAKKLSGIPANRLSELEANLRRMSIGLGAQ